MIVKAVQVGGIAFLRKGVIGMHLLQYVQIIILVVDGRISQFLIIIPADNVAAVIRLAAVSRAFDPDLLGDEHENVFTMIDLFEHSVCQTDVSLQEVWRILLYIRIDIQGKTLFPDLGKIVVGDHDIGHVPAVHCVSVLLRRQVFILDLHTDPVFKILPHPQMVFAVHPGAAAVDGIADRQYPALLTAGG